MENADLKSVAEIIRIGYGERSDDSLDWSLLKSPVFRADFSAVAEVESKVVGCWLSTLQDLKVAPGFVVRAGSGLVVVHPDYRRLGIGTSLYSWRRGLAGTSEALIGFGVAAPETRRLFWSRIGSAPLIHDCGIIYAKLLSTKPLQQSLRNLSPSLRPVGSDGKRGKPLYVHVDVSGIVPFCVRVESGGMSICDGCDGDIRIVGEIRSLNIWSLLLSFATGSLRVSGKRHIPRLLWLLGTLRGFVRVMRGLVSD